MRTDRKTHLKTDKKAANRSHKRGIVGYSKKTALLEDAITQMNAGKYGRSSAALKELLALEPHNMEARRLFATLHLRLGSLIPARQAFDSLVDEAFDRQDYWLAESLLREYLAAGPRCVPYLEKLGSVHERKGNASEAVAEYGKAIDILIEDPDPANPQHACQLYAKIRDLAPAGPVAFRLASFFDAHTGELLVRPPAIQREAPVATPSSPTVEAGVSAPSMPEPMTAAVPWEESEDAPESTLVPPVSQVVPPVPSDEAVRLASTSGPTQADAIETVPSYLTPDAIPNRVAPNTLDEAPATFRESGSSHVNETELTSAQSPVSQTYETPSPYLQAGAGTESIPAPMPWEDILESIITIPDHPSTSVPPPADRAEGTLIAAPCEPESAVPARDESLEVAPSVPVVDAPVQTGLVTEAPAVTPQAPPPVQDQGNVSQGLAEASKFSWQSVFNSTWKFGEKSASNEPQPESAQANGPHIEAPPPSTMSSLEADLSEAEPVEIPEPADVRGSTDPASASGVAPMPWDQVQDSNVTIPSTQDEEAIADLPVGQPVQSAGAVEPDPALSAEAVPDQALSEPSVTPTDSTPEPDWFSMAQAPSDPPVPEQEFRFASSVSAGSVQESQDSNVQMASTSSALTGAGEAWRLAAPEPPAFTNAPAVTARSEPALAEQEPATTAPSRDAPSAPVPIAEPAPPEVHPPSMFSPLPGESPELTRTPSTIGSEQVAGLDEPLARAAISDRLSAGPESAVEPDQASLSSTGDPSHRKTGEPMAETNRPASKRRRKSVPPEPEPEIILSRASSEEALNRPAEQSHQQDEAVVEPKASLPSEAGIQKEALQKEEWIRTGETIRFVEQPTVSAVPETAPQTPPQTISGAPQSMSTAAAAVDVLFDSCVDDTRRVTRGPAVETKSRPKRRSGINRIRTRISSFLGSCFSTTRSIVMSLIALVALSGALTAIAVGAVGLTWIIMEKPPSPAYQNLTGSPQRTLSDPKKNGYLLLLGFDAAADQDPIQVGYERKPDPKDADMALVCLGGIGGGKGSGQQNASASMAGEWFSGPNPVRQFKAHQSAIAGWVSKGESALSRYKQWQRLSFEDWGFGQTMSPPCASILFTHRLYLAEGFLPSADTGVDRLETDMESWRIALAQAKTLPVKTLALQAINDDIAVASGLLVQPDFDGKYLPRLTKLLRPLDQVELSIRWPMQSELVSATKTFEARLKAERVEEQSLTAAVASALPLPKQRRLNAYAEYYEASYKAAGEGRHGALPRWKNYIQFPPSTVMDYLANPIENVVGLEPLAPWDLYNGLVVDTDARLRLATLQAWLRRGPQDADLLARIAKAGQNFYDPYTGLPMLVNRKKGSMYSVGHDGRDQDADPQADVVVAIPMNSSVPAGQKTSSGSPKSR
ncbi:MAG: tetratricopeptide repeat protein [Nitrospiraceae bacterium]